MKWTPSRWSFLSRLSARNPMKLIVRNELGESVSIQIHPQETFFQLIKRVENEVGISLDLGDLKTDEKKLVDTQNVMEYFLKNVMADGKKPEKATLIELKIPSSDAEATSSEVKAVCSVPGCGNTKVLNGDKVFFDFPQEEIRCHQWMLYCQRLCMISGKARLNLSKDSTICSNHFRPDQFVKNTSTLLKRTAVPCINPKLPAVDGLKCGNTPKVQSSRSEDSNEELICRLCGLGCRDYIFIYGKEGTLLNLAGKINSLLPVNVKMTDDLPKQVCGPCVEQLNCLSYLVNISINSETKFSTTMKHNSPNNIVLTDGKLVTLEVALQCALCKDGTISKLTTHEPQCPKEPEKIILWTGAVKDDATNFIGVDESTQETIKSEVEAVLYSCRVCGEEFNEFPSVVQHSFTHFVDGFYLCVICQQSYATPIEMIDHLFCHKPQNIMNEGDSGQKSVKQMGDSDEQLVKCQICPKTFRSPSRLDFHMHFHNNNNLPQEKIDISEHTVETQSVEKYKCEECEVVFHTAHLLKQHVKSHLNELFKPYVCDWCSKGFLKKNILKNHISSVHRSVQEVTCFACNICKEAFITTALAISHMDSKHNEDVQQNLHSYSFKTDTVSRLLICEYCEKYFAEIDTLNAHREGHVSDTPYNCKICSMKFPTFLEHNKHKHSHNNSETPLEYRTQTNITLKYLCEFCNRGFISHLKYTEHLTIHYGPKPYICRICNEKFANLKEFSQHRLCHGTEEVGELFDFNRPYECHYCTKCFAIEDALVKHIRMHTGEKPFTCDQCGKGFSQSSGLNTHKKVHSDLRPYSCPLCPRMFKIKGDRDVHIRKHSGDRPFKCDFCGKSFMTQHVYSQHRKIHTGERPYKCDICGMAFRRSHVLTVHKRIHTGEKPNVCDICGKRYRQKGDMLKHRRSLHPNNTAKPL